MKKIFMKECKYGVIQFVTVEECVCTIKDAVHTINNDEYSLKPKRENYWKIFFSVEGFKFPQIYQFDCSNNILSKYYTFRKLVLENLKKDIRDFKSIVGLKVIIEVKKTYTLNNNSNWSSDSIITNMTLFNDEDLS